MYSYYGHNFFAKNDYWGSRGNYGKLSISTSGNLPYSSLPKIGQKASFKVGLPRLVTKYPVLNSYLTYPDLT